MIQPQLLPGQLTVCIVDMGAELRPESRHIASMAELSRKELWLDHDVAGMKISMQSLVLQELPEEVL
jgi:hypothetical protein